MAYNEPIDMNEFLNLDHEFHSPTDSPLPKSEPSYLPNSNVLLSQRDPAEQHRYAGPSHDYGQFKQQTGLPTGAISHLGAVNDYNNQARPTPFGAHHFPHGYSSGVALDRDLEPSSAHAFSEYHFAPEHPPGEYAHASPVDPSMQPPSAVKAWPGMHTRRAEQEQQMKAERIAQDQRRRQQQQQQQLSMQRQLPQDFQPTVPGSSSHMDQPTSHPSSSSDAHVNDQISRLLNQMRHNSSASVDGSENGLSNPNDAASNAGNLANREDEDMDEDERLLASEEGKKLSSKERRQLRNKVSARAFRSRRKEYISQLEGEVATKSQECDDLRSRNRFLTEQNSQLIALTRSVIGHPGFQTYMSEMSNDPSILATINQHTNNASGASSGSESARLNAPQQGSDDSRESSTHPQQQSHSSSHQQPKDVSASGYSMNANPESNLNFGLLNLGNSTNNWTGVFMLQEVPNPPLEIMSQPRISKELELPSFTMASVLDDEKTDLPSHIIPLADHRHCLSRPSVAMEPANMSKSPEPSFDDPRFPLFVSPAPQSQPLKDLSVSKAARLLERSLCEKTNVGFNLVTVSSERGEGSYTTTSKRVENLIASMESLSQRIKFATEDYQ